VLTLLIDLLTVALPEDRRLAAQLLGLNRLNATSWTLSERACAGLRVLARDPDATVRVQALHSLGEGRDAGSLATVIGSLADSSTKVRHAAALAAGKIGDPRAQQVLVRVLTRREDVTVQAAVCAALHRLECSAGSLAALVAALLRSSGDGLEPLQRGAVAALSRWSDPAAVLAAFRQSSVLGRATTRTPDVRAAACEVLGHLFGAASSAEHGGSGGPPPAPISRSGSSSSLLWRSFSPRPPQAGAERAAAHAMLASLLGDADETVRLQATAAIGKIALPKAVSPLVPMLRDPAPGVVDEARGALLRLDWSGLLRPGEAVLLSGPCLRQTTSLVGHVSMQTSMLVLCDSGRLFCVDAKEPLADTEVELDQRSSAAAPGVLALVGEGRPLPVQPVLQRPEEWVRAVHGLRRAAVSAETRRRRADSRLQQEAPAAARSPGLQVGWRRSDG